MTIFKVNSWSPFRGRRKGTWILRHGENMEMEADTGVCVYKTRTSRVCSRRKERERSRVLLTTSRRS